MFALIPLAVALQGIGYGSFLTALQGLADATAVPATDSEEPTSGAHAPIKARRRVRRAVYLPTPWVDASEMDLEREDEELLFELGVL